MFNPAPRKKARIIRKQTRGFSLVEMIAATALVAGTLAPALAVMRDAMTTSREASRRILLANYATSLLESAAALAMQNWTTSTTSGNLASDGQPSLRYTVTRSDAPASGGLTGRLMHIQVTVYDDANGNSARDTSELAVSLRTKVAKLVTYQNEPN
jgi:prepilin-type N-terminal cleavage/methylation domain-containing protein